MSAENEQEEKVEHKAIDNLIENISGLVDTYVEVAQLEIKNRLAHVITYFILASLLVFFIFFVLFFLSLGIAIIINTLSGLSFLGYFIVGALYLILLIACFSQRKAIKARIDLAIAARTKND